MNIPKRMPGEKSQTLKATDNAERYKTSNMESTTKNLTGTKDGVIRHESGCSGLHLKNQCNKV